MIKARGLTKVFGKIVAVDGIDLDIEEGEIYVFLGPNGAGKTTTLKMLTGVMKPTFGKIEIAGIDVLKDPISVKKIIGVVPDEPKIYPTLKGWEFLKFVEEVYDLKRDKRVEERREYLIEALGVDYLDRYVFEMSHGMKQKLLLVSVLMRWPKVLFLDEPTVGLDIVATAVLREILKKMASEGATVFLTTHILDIAEKLASRVGIINRGKLVAEGSPEDLMKMAGEEGLEEVFIKLTGSEERLKELMKGI